MNWLDMLTTAAALSPLGLTVLLVAIGMMAVAAEVLFIPGFGVAGILGGVVLIAGIASAWINFGAFWGGVAVFGTLTGTVGLVIVAFKSKRLRRHFVLDTQLRNGGGTASQDLLAFLGKQGITLTALRPAGMAEFDNQRIDVVSEGGYIERGTAVKVVEIEGPRVIVAPVS